MSDVDLNKPIDPDEMLQGLMDMLLFAANHGSPLAVTTISQVGINQISFIASREHNFFRGNPHKFTITVERSS